MTALPSCPNATIWRASCKRRGCPVCGVRWARDWLRVLLANLLRVGAPVVMLTITAPGRKQLPWDRTRCRHRDGVRCDGTRHGCRVQERALREWSDTATLRLRWMRNAASQATRRAGHESPRWIVRAWEPQKRGAPHVHVVMRYGTAEERAAVDVFAAEIVRLAPRYAFGRVHLSAPTPGETAARYLTSYLTGRTGRKNTIRENIADPRLPRSLVWLTADLTRVSLVTMRTVRRARHLYAAVQGACDPPRMRFAEAVIVGHVFGQVYRRRAGPGEDEPPPPELDRERLELARWLDESGLVRMGDDVARKTALLFASEAVRAASADRLELAVAA